MKKIGLIISFMRYLYHFHAILLSILFCTTSFAQEQEKPLQLYGYSSNSPEYRVEPADYAIHYKRTQVVVNNQTKNQEFLTDTLTLVVGKRWSVFYNITYNDRFSSWGMQNVKKTRQATKPTSLQLVPLSSVLDKKNASLDYVEGNFGEPTVVYVDRNENRIISLLYAPYNILNEKKEFHEWSLFGGNYTILNYLCRQARTQYAGKDYTAWYAPDIPIPDGPWKFFGLPGLILKIEDSDGLIVFEAIGLEMLGNAYITMKDDYEKVSYTYFNKVSNEARSVRKGSFLFDGELFLTENRPFSYPEIEPGEK